MSLRSQKVFEIMEARGLLDKLNTSNAKWANVKIGIMAWFSAKLRKRLLEVTEQLAAKDLEIAQLHVRWGGGRRDERGGRERRGAVWHGAGLRGGAGGRGAGKQGPSKWNGHSKGGGGECFAVKANC